MNADIFIIFFCAAIVGVPLVAIISQSNLKDRLSNRFAWICITAIAFFLITGITELLEGCDCTVLVYVTNLLSFLLIDCTVVSFTKYLHVLLSDSDNTDANKKAFNLVMMTSCIRVVLILILFFTGNLFVVEYGHYYEQSLSIIPYLISLVVMCELMFIVIKNHRTFDTKEFVVIILYLLLPVPPILIELYTNVYYLTVVSMTLSILIIYTMIQAGVIERNRLKANVMEELSHMDLLTNLGNRRAYYKYISKFLPEQNIGIIFSDINGLKYTNDHFGHNSGDNLIITYSNILKEVFGNNGVFRISGDEFVVVLSNISEEKFKAKYYALMSKISENQSLAAAGEAYGTGACFERLVSEAEEKMYEMKRVHHQNRK